MARKMSQEDFEKMLAKKARKARKKRQLEGLENLVQTFKDNGVSVQKIETAYIYVVENKSFSGWYKIGTTTDLNARLAKYQTSDPLRGYSIRDKWITCFRFEIEREFLAYAERSILFEVKGEWVYSDDYSRLRGRLDSFVQRFKKQAKKKKKIKAKLADFIDLKDHDGLASAKLGSPNLAKRRKSYTPSPARENSKQACSLSRGSNH